MCRSKIIGSHVLDIGGGHFLSSKYPEVYDFIFQHISKSEFNYFDRVSKIKLDNEIIDYPVESNIWQLSPEKQIEYLISLARAGEISGDKSPNNYAEWIKWKLGDKIASEYMLPYNKKIWGVDPTEMDIDWLHKIPRLAVAEIFKASLSQHSDLDKFPSHQGFFYPKRGGFQQIFNSIYSKVSNNTKLNYKVSDLKWEGTYWTVNNDIKAKKIINTIPWKRIFEASGKPAEIKDDISKLKSNSLVVSLYEQSYSHNYHWLYLPSEQINHHREFYVHNFAPHSATNTLYTETNLKRWSKATSLNGNMPLFEYINEVAYPIPVLGHAHAAKKVRAYYASKNMLSVGRWGQWQYLNSDVCIKEAMNLVESL